MFHDSPKPITEALELAPAFNSPDIFSTFRLLNSFIIEFGALILKDSPAIPVTATSPCSELLFAIPVISPIVTSLNRWTSLHPFSL
jgi:hypothetical protein